MMPIITFALEDGGMINVTREEFESIRDILHDSNGHTEDARAICELLNLPFSDMIYKHWKLKIVPKVKTRLGSS